MDEVDTVVSPLDQLNLHCVYDTSKVDENGVTFGLRSSQEMCIVFLWYFPASPSVSTLCGSVLGESFCDYTVTPQFPLQPVRDEGDTNTLVPVTAFAQEDQSDLLTNSPLALPSFSPTPMPTTKGYGYGSRKEMGVQFKVRVEL